MNYTVLAIGILVVILLVVGIGYVVYSNIPEHVCPSEEDCDKAWEEIQKLDQKVVDQGDCLENIIIVE